VTLGLLRDIPEICHSRDVPRDDIFVRTLARVLRLIDRGSAIARVGDATPHLPDETHEKWPGIVRVSGYILQPRLPLARPEEYLRNINARPDEGGKEEQRGWRGR